MSAPSAAVLCPGAGTYVPALCARLHTRYPAVRELLSRFTARAGDFLHEACVTDSFAAMRRISRNHPAIVAAGLLAVAAAEEEAGGPLRTAVAGGYSLGHFTALALAGAIDPVDAIALVVVRARLMEEAAERRPGAMLLVGGATADELHALVAARPREAGVLVVACRNAADSAALSGDVPAVAWAAERLRDHRVKKVPAGVAAHSPLMREAQDAFAVRLEKVAFAAPRIPVLLNSDGLPCTDPERIKSELMTQLTTPVRWDLCVESIATLQVKAIIDVGPGRMMANYCSRIAPAVHLNAMEPLDVALRGLTA